MAQGQRSGIDSVTMTLSIPDRCPCAIQIRPFELPYGLFITTQGHGSRSSLRPCLQVLKEEKVLGQKFVVDVTMSVCLRAAAASDDLVDTVNYAAAFDLVKTEVEVQSRQGSC